MAPTDKSFIRKPVSKSGIAVGKNAGHKTHKRYIVPKPSQRKGALTKRVKFVRDLVREVCGFAPYERRVIELLRVGKDKRARKLAKRRLGTMVRAKRKVEEMNSVLMAQRRAAATH
eukprot:CAMPEP_0197013210 /NCGR_PEP_ID=MMETSP1380-20130617/65515_1 /TAXON_ID=5936 /ORGANISM="Euplotes crassus, Strain CT5" /LENGTH=115 /DNA_ID=CAMNT_0042437289 /DNA_START=21 /DNA_END=368 /DNA_ORIENTATION=-